MRSDPSACRNCDGIGEDDEIGICSVCDGTGKHMVDCTGCGERFAWEDLQSNDWCGPCADRAAADDDLDRAADEPDWDRLSDERRDEGWAP